MARSRLKSKGRREHGQFMAIPISILESAEYARLNGNAVKMLIDLYSQYNGRNNGDFTVAWSVMRERGWKSKSSLYAALNKLEAFGWIVKTRQGGKHVCNLYAVTWRSIDECNGKIEVTPTSTPSNVWKQIKNAAPHVDHISLTVVPIRQARA